MFFSGALSIHLMRKISVAITFDFVDGSYFKIFINVACSMGTSMQNNTLLLEATDNIQWLVINFRIFNLILMSLKEI